MNEEWKKAFGWSLYREYHDDDNLIQQRIRIPTNNSQEEFDTVIMNLAKMLVDYIDISNLQGSNRDGSINKLEDFLKDKNIKIDISGLRILQSLRSTGVVHSKGEKYDKLRNLSLTGDVIDDAKAIISNLTGFMNSLTVAIKGADYSDTI